MSQTSDAAHSPDVVYPLTLSRKEIFLDVAERVVIASLFMHFAYHVGFQHTRAPNIITVLLLLSEIIPFILILIRPPSSTLSQRPMDWLFGLAGSAAPLLISPVDVNPLIPQAVCLVLILSGLFIQISAKIVLGSSFGIVAANRGVKIIGPYRFVRHPMYAGYVITHIGLLLAMPSLFNAALYVFALGLQIVRIQREERILRLDPAYRDLASRVRYRLLPGVF